MNRLHAVTELFAASAPEERLALLADYAERLPSLPPERAAERDAGLYIVEGCRSGVFFRVGLTDGLLRIHADAPAEVPVPRGFVALLIELFDGVPPETVGTIPGDWLDRLHLTGVLGLQRRAGLTAILERLRTEAGKHAHRPSTI